MSDQLDTKIAPKLDRKTHVPIRLKTGWAYWYIKDYPGHKVLGNDIAKWSQSDWDTAINIFEDRIYGRFLNIVESVEKGPFSGFATMALDCLLCETLQQFYDGVDESKGSTKAFIKFLTTSSFQLHFGNDITPKTSMAAIFYDQIRSGILHMAEVKKASKLNVHNSELLVRWSDNTHTGLVVQRKKFHSQLVREFEKYLESLRNPPIVTDDPWKSFKKKMDYICRV